MPKTGFFNDNEYRAYPFVYKQETRSRQQQFGGPAAYDKIKQAIHGAIVDAGFIFDIDCVGTPQQELLGLRVWLESIAASTSTNGFTATFATTAAAVKLVFTVEEIPNDWVTIKTVAEVEPSSSFACAAETPRWRGYIVAAANNALREAFATAELPLNNAGRRVFTANAAADPFEFEIEQSRLQNKAKSYLRSITVANFARVQVPPCGQTENTQNRTVVVNTPCIRGPITFEEGYNCQITQINRDSAFTIAARKDAGAQKDAEYCANKGEIPLFSNEEKPEGSKFYSGGPACNELLYTINGVGGRNIALIPGNGITISVENNKIVVGAQSSLVTDCVTAAADEPPDPSPNP